MLMLSMLYFVVAISGDDKKTLQFLDKSFNKLINITF